MLVKPAKKQCTGFRGSGVKAQAGVGCDTGKQFGPKYGFSVVLALEVLEDITCY
ncbi:MAG: hypothetical protein ACJA09_003525 [Alcanivorax sp.]